jgi:nicotinate-nucleotide adenylyltransferase
MRLGIMGGTFDPIHNGHLWIADAARTQLNLDRVLFIPNEAPPHKRSAYTSSRGRAEMVGLAIEPTPQFELSMIEIERGGTSYAVDTLRTIQDRWPKAELFFIVGSDTMVDVPNWRQPDQILRMCRFAVVPRPDALYADELSQLTPEYQQQIDMLPPCPLDISSTDLRNRVAGGLSLQGLTPDAVVAYIEQHGLYKAL